MKLINCYIENFGKLHGYKYSFSDGLNVILEENGWGKTTFAAFIKAMFYGMDYTTRKSISENERKRYMPWQGGQYGGYIVFAVNDKVYRIERFFGVKDKDDRYTLYDENTGMVSQDFGQRPGEELFGLDAFAFERSTFIPQELKEPAINDSLSAKLSNTTASGDVDSYNAAVDVLDNRLKFYKKTGDRGQIAEIERQIAEINHSLEQCNNKEESVEALKEKKAELENRRIELFNELKEIREEVKKTSEYEGVKARKSHYEMLLKNQLEAKNSLVRAKLFFEKPELIKEIEDKKDEYDRYVLLERKYRDESENLKEIEYRKHGLETQFASQKKTPVLSFMLILLGILAIGCGVILWAVMNMDIIVMTACAGVGALLIIVGIATWVLGTNRIKKQFKTVIEDVDEQIDCSRSALRDVTLRREQSKKTLENYVKSFQVSDPDNIIKSLTEIESRIKEYGKLSKDNDKTLAELAEFESNNDMDKIRNLEIPRHSLSELQKREAGVNTTLMGVMEEKNSIVRRMDALINADEDENDLLQMKENLTEQLEESKKQYELLSITKEFLGTANERFKTKYIQNMKDAFKGYVEELNGISGKNISVDNISVDIDLNVSIEEYGEKRGAEHYSTGYKDMLRLCTRFALIKAMFTSEQPFVILDDPFVNLDNDKMSNAMKLLEELAENNQILYFTCHESRA